MAYTAVTFAPVQSFIRSSRKLRDLYGSSLLLSHLARALYLDASNLLGAEAVVSPAGVSISRGVPNTLVIAGAYSQASAREALLKTWGHVLNTCRKWLEATLDVAALQAKAPSWDGVWETGWGASWRAASLHSWELFHAQGATIEAAREALAIVKRERDWRVPNWTGESSTVSSAEAVVRPTMAMVVKPWSLDATAAQQEARALLRQLSDPKRLGEAFAEENEELSLLELVKRLITYEAILKDAFALQSAEQLSNLLQTFPQLSTWKSKSIIWFMADGDQVSQHIKSLASQKGEERALRDFSSMIQGWATELYTDIPACMSEQTMPPAAAKASLVYAGGDDVLGALHESMPGKDDLEISDLWRWLHSFYELWQRVNQSEITTSKVQPEITISMGLVWADANVPQREALQHARDAESSAKTRGRNRFALRLLYQNGNHLEWTCPWLWLQPILSNYRDREGLPSPNASWRHLAEDLLWLRERQAIAPFTHPSIAQVQDRKFLEKRNKRADETAQALWKAYFPELDVAPFLHPEEGRPFHWWLLDLGLVMAGLETREGTA